MEPSSDLRNSVAYLFGVFSFTLLLSQGASIKPLNITTTSGNPLVEYAVEIANVDRSNSSNEIYSRQLPPKVVGGILGGGIGGGIGGAIGGGVGYLVGGPVGGGVGGAVGGDRKGTGGLIGGKIGGGNGAAIGAGVGGAVGGGIGGFLAGPFGGGLGGLLGGGAGGGLGAAYLPDQIITHEEDAPGFPKRNITVPEDADVTDTLPFESKSNFADRLRLRISKLRLRVTNAIRNGIK